MTRFLFAALLLVLPAAANAQIIEFDFQGNDGFGLLPGNEVGDGTSFGSNSPAIGGEVGGGLVLNAATNTLDFDFEFSGLTGGLANIASGIHLHQGNTPADADPFDQTGGIVLNLNSGADANVTLQSTLLGFGAGVTSGRVTGSATLTDALEDALLAGEIYLNIHSGTFGGGELRGNLVAVPEPTTAALGAFAGLLSLAGLGRRQR